MYYINKCRELNHIAFFQWRTKFPSKFSRAEELEELEHKKLMILLWNAKFSTEFNPDQIILTSEESQELDDFHETY